MKRYIAFCLMTVIFCCSFFGCAEALPESGISEIRATKENGGFTVTIDQFGCEKYSVQFADENEKLPYGESVLEYDGRIGKNVVKIILHDASYGKETLTDKNFEAYTPYDLTENTKFMLGKNAEHSVIIYIGSDKELTVTEEAGIENPLAGSFSVDIGIK